MIKLNVSAANIAVEEKETLTEGRVGLLCRFSFTGEWDGLAKTAVFDGADSRDVILRSDTVAVPAECLATEGYSLSVGVYGKNAAGDIVIPTVYATVGKIQRSAYPSGKETAAPTPDVVAQIQQAAANAEAMARSVREDADLGKFNGGQGPQGPAGATGPKGDTGAAGEAGGYYTPAVTQPDENTLRVAFTPSKKDMPAVEPADITIPTGGGSGTSGEDGGYYAPSVDDAGNLTWTASKTNMPAVDGANIKGPRGDTGATGAQGPAGATGPAGADGKSAYAYAVEGGYTGTEAEFAAKLAKEKFANPNALTFTGAVTGSYDGSAPLSVEIPQGGTGGGGALAGLTIADNYDIELISNVIIDQNNIPTAGITVTQKDDGSPFAYDGLLIWSDAKSSSSYTTFNFNGYTNYSIAMTHGNRNFLNLYITDGVTMLIQTSESVRNVIKQSYADTGNLFYPDPVFQRVPEKFTSFKIGADGIASVTFYKAWGLTRK